jgi:small-conductance mechanosensitive channel
MEIIEKITNRWMDISVFFAIIFIIFIALMIIRRYVFLWLFKYAEKTESKLDDIILASIKSPSVFWILIFGIITALQIVIIPVKLYGFSMRAVGILLIGSLFLVIAKILSHLIPVYTEKFKEFMPVTTLTQVIVKIVVFTTGGLIILDLLGISITPILTALGVGGLAIALALQDTLSNLFAGIHIIVAKNIGVGDYIRLDSGHEGYIMDIGWRCTRIRELSNNIIFVPNSKLSQAVVTNYHLPDKELSITVPLCVSYESDLDRVEKITLEVAKQILLTTEGGSRNFEPVIRFREFGESSVNFNVVLRAGEFSARFVLVHEFVKAIKERYQKEGIIIPFPARSVYLMGDKENEKR